MYQNTFTYVKHKETNMNDRPSRRSARIRTMEEFSVASGISRPTLSRFFNDPESVRPASRRRIEDAMDRLGYRPNLFAVNFNRRKPKTLGIIVPSLMDPFYAALVQRIEFQASLAGYWTVIQNSQGDPDREAEAVATLISIKTAGTVVVPLGEASRKDLYQQMGNAMPLVFLDARADADGAFVGTDNHFSMGLMVDYLLRSGTPPSYFDMPAVNQNARERREAYESSMLERGAEPVIFQVRSLGWDFERLAFEEATRLLRSGIPLKGTILCANDRVAFGVMAAACQTAISIGRLATLRVAGHDDHPLSQYACPSLTTVAQDVDRLATLSLDRLMQGISDGANSDSTDRLEARLIMRDSA
jgi:DNA-binding LacI/PurR family transcriptional regulator